MGGATRGVWGGVGSSPEPGGGFERTEEQRFTQRGGSKFTAEVLRSAAKKERVSAANRPIRPALRFVHAHCVVWSPHIGDKSCISLESLFTSHRHACVGNMKPMKHVTNLLLPSQTVDSALATDSISFFQLHVPPGAASQMPDWQHLVDC